MSLDDDLRDISVDSDGEIDDLLEDGDYSAVDSMLEEVDVANTNSTVLVGYAGATYVVAQMLEYRETFMSDVYDELVDRGLDADDILEGLIEAREPSSFVSVLPSQKRVIEDFLKSYN